MTDNKDNWPDSVEQARDIQASLRKKVICKNELPSVNFVAGVDVGFEDRGKTTRAAVAVLKYPELSLHEQAVTRTPTCFPYVPGYLSFRELPGILTSLAQLTITPDLILCDGQGIAHPRRFGLACHLGVITGLPTIGVAKSRLTGSYTEPGQNKGDWTPLFDKLEFSNSEAGKSNADESTQGNREIIGAVLRTRHNVKPLFISIGHRINLETAINYVLDCTTRYRLPETTRWAHRLASG